MIYVLAISYFITISLPILMRSYDSHVKYEETFPVHRCGKNVKSEVWFYAAIPYIARSTIGLLSDSYALVYLLGSKCMQSFIL